MGRFSYSKTMKLLALNKNHIYVFLFTEHSKYRYALHAILVNDIAYIQWYGPYTLSIQYAITYRFIKVHPMIFSQ